MNTRKTALSLALSSLALAATGCGSELGNDPESAETIGKAESALSTDPVYEVRVRFLTGSDDKRSDSVVKWQLSFAGNVYTYNTDGSGTRWANDTWSDNFNAFPPAGTTQGDIWSLGVRLQTTTGITADNWNIDSIAIWTKPSTSGAWTRVGTPTGSPLVRLTGSSPQWWTTFPE